MSAKRKTVAAMAAELADDPTIESDVEALTQRSRLVRTLVDIRVTKKLTQEQIAAAMHCDQSRVSRIENGYDEDITYGDMVAYANAAGCSLNLLFDDIGAPAATRIKQHVFAIQAQLNSLATLAEKTGDERVLVAKIHEFMGEVLFNFLVRFDTNYKRVHALMPVNVPSLPKAAPHPRLPHAPTCPHGAAHETVH